MVFGYLNPKNCSYCAFTEQFLGFLSTSDSVFWDYIQSFILQHTTNGSRYSCLFAPWTTTDCVILSKHLLRSDGKCWIRLKTDDGRRKKTKTCTSIWNNFGLFPEGFWNHSSQTVTNRQLPKDGSCKHMPEAIILMRAGTGTKVRSLATSRRSLELKQITVLHCWRTSRTSTGPQRPSEHRGFPSVYEY